MATNKYVNAVYDDLMKKRTAENTGSTSPASTPKVTNKYVNAVYFPEQKPVAAAPKVTPQAAKPATTTIINPAANQNNTLIGKATEGATQVKTEYDFKAAERRMDELKGVLALLRNDQNIDKQAEYIDTYGAYKALKGEYEAAKAQKWYADTGNEIASAAMAGSEGLFGNLREAASLYDIDMAERMALNAPGVGPLNTNVQDELSAAKAKLPANVDADWLEYARHANERETFNKSVEEARAYAEDRPVGSSVASVPLNLMSGAGGVDVLGKKIGKMISGSEAPINFQSAAMIPSAAAQEIRSTVSEDMSATGSMLYNVGMSIADSAAIVGMSAFGIHGGSALLGSSAATSTMRAASERGASENQAIVLGLIAGAAEAFFEKYSIESLLKPNGAKGAKAFFENFFKQGVTEMTEEGATTLANTAADLFVMGDKSELAYRKQQLIADGYSEEEANRIAGTEWVKNFGVDLLGGLISGGFFSTVKSAAGGISNAATKTDSRYNEMMRDLDRIMPRLPQEQSAAFQTAQEAAVPNAPNTAPTETNVAQGTADDAVSEVLPNVAEHRDTATQILNDGIFDSPTYGDALEQTGMKRSDVRQALRKIAQNTPGAELDSDVQSVIGAIRNVDTQADTFTQTTPEQRAAETVSDQAGKTERAPVNENVDADNASTIVDEADETPANPAMGAADYGYSGDIGGWKRDADTFTKDTEIPKYDKNGNTISDSAGTMFNMNVPKETKEMIERFSYEGEFSIQRDTNNAQVDRVHDDIAKSSFNDVYNQTVGAVLNGQASADITARLGVLMVQAANRAEANPGQGYDAQAAILAKLTAQHGHNAASALQAYNIFNKLTPQGRLAGTQKIVEQLNNSVKVRNPVPENEQSDFTKAVRGAVNEALKDLENIGDAPEAPVTGDAAVGAVVAEAAKSAADGDEAPKRKNAKKKAERDHGLEVENWMTEVGKEVAKALDAKPKAQTPKPISRIIRQDILKLAKPHWPQAPKTQSVKRTAADTITDFFANREQYVKAWNAALEEYRAMHGLGEDFTGPAGAGAEPMMIQAIVDEATAQELKKQKIELFSYLGDQASIEKQLANGLIKRTNATGDDADTIRRAVSQYVSSVLYDTNIERIGNGLDRDIRKVVKEIGGSMYEIVRDNKGNKAGAAKIVANMMVKQYGISKDAAQAASTKIVERFNAMIAQKTQKALDAIFADKKKAEPRSAAQKITELGNLGAFESEAYKGKAADKAKQFVDTDIKKAVKAIGKDAAEIIRSSPADKKATAERIKQMLMEKHRLHEADAKRLGDFIIDRFNNYVNVRAKDALENYVKPKNKRQQKTLEERFRDMANMGAFSSPYASDVAQKLFGANIHIDPELVTEYLNATDPKDIRTVEEKIYENIGKQIPSTFADKWNAWRFMGMLGTIKAPIRNNLGNIGGWAMRNAKNLPASIGEAVLQRIGIIDQSQRTKTFLPAGKERRDAAKRDFDYVKREVAGVGKYNIANQAIEDNRRIFTPRMINLLKRLGANLPEKADNISVEGLRKAINVMMSDTLFSKDAYVSSLANYLRAQGFTGADFESGKMTQEQKDAARAYAIQEAQEATYKDFNTFTELVTSVRFNPERAKSRHGKMAMKAGNVVLQGIQPILKTPANILARSIEYTPFGLATTIVDAAVSKKRGDYKVTKALNDLSKNSVGLLLSALGWFWAANGKLVISSGDEDQDDLEGKAKYSLIHNGTAYSLDWLAPIAPALFMGAAFYDLFDKRSENGAPLFDKIANVFNSLTNPMIEMSVLSGLKSSIENVRYAENGATAIVMNAAIDYLGQAIPTIWGQIEKAASSPVQERTLVDKGDPILNADLQRVLGTISKKIPGWDYNQVPYIDAWGRVTETGGPLERFWDSVVSPFNKSEIIVTPVDEEIRRLEKELDGVNLTPSKADSDITVNGEQVILTNEEYVTYAMEKGQGDLAIRMMELSDPDYQNLNASAKGRAQLCSKDLADNLAKIAAGFELKDMPDWQAELVGASVEEMAQACIKQAIINEASSSQYENRSDGFSHMLSDKSIDDQIALALMSKEASDTYTAFTEVMNVPVQQFLDIYGTATAASKKKDEQWAAAVQRIRGMDISNSEKYTLEFGMYYSFMMGKELREKYNAHVKGSSISNGTYMDAAKYYNSYNPEEHGGVKHSEAMYDYVRSVCQNITEAKTLFLGFYSESTWEDEYGK